NGLLAEAKDENAIPSNRKQLMEVEPFVRIGQSMYGHPLGGDVFPTARRWLERYADRTPKARNAWSDNRPLPSSVVEAMRSSWRSLARKDLRKYARENGGSISSDGRFIFNCFGNACDIAMYPEGSPRDAEMPSRFSCHNLDGPIQQLTLLAGVAALFDLISSEN
ncbi:MAG TPA: hypothetical protein VMT80_00005, partial [Candidatus Paceibacterota bacterium]|nr:hypothetical protein [Candidatus Paceibacterota bacterium]